MTVIYRYNLLVGFLSTHHQPVLYSVTRVICLKALVFLWGLSFQWSVAGLNLWLLGTLSPLSWARWSARLSNVQQIESPFQRERKSQWIKLAGFENAPPPILAFPLQWGPSLWSTGMRGGQQHISNKYLVIADEASFRGWVSFWACVSSCDFCKSCQLYGQFPSWKVLLFFFLNEMKHIKISSWANYRKHVFQISIRIT